MTGPHLCEYENWPGVGVETTGRRPTPLVLALLAATYKTSVHDPLDLADYQHMPPGDRLIPSKAAPAEEQGHRPEAGKSQPPPGPAGQAGIAPRQAFGVMGGWHLPPRNPGGTMTGCQYWDRSRSGRRHADHIDDQRLRLGVCAQDDAPGGLPGLEAHPRAGPELWVKHDDELKAALAERDIQPGQ